MDVLRAQAAVLAGEQGEHLLAGAAGAVAGARELAMRVIGPASSAIGRMVARLMRTRMIFSKLARVLARLVIAVLLLVAAVAVVTGREDEAAGGDGRAPVVATTTQAADLARNVAGDDVEVVGLLAPNADPHDYEVRPHDLQALADADLVVRSGGDVDEWLQEAIEGAGRRAGAHADDASTLGRRPALVAGPAQRDRRRRACARARARRTDATPRYTARLRALDRAVAACIAKVPPRGASS